MFKVNVNLPIVVWSFTYLNRLYCFWNITNISKINRPWRMQGNIYYLEMPDQISNIFFYLKPWSWTYQLNSKYTCSNPLYIYFKIKSIQLLEEFKRFEISILEKWKYRRYLKQFEFIKDIGFLHEIRKNCFAFFHGKWFHIDHMLHVVILQYHIYALWFWNTIYCTFQNVQPC